MKKSKIAFLAAAAVSALALTACGNSSNTNSSNSTTKVGNFEITYKNPSKAVTGGDLQLAYVSDSPMKAEWLSPLSDDATFSTMSGPSGGGLFNVNSSFKIEDGGAANVKFDKSAKTATITLRSDLKWSDGSQVTAKDYEFSYELIANPAYGSSRWTDSLTNIVGMDAYHAKPTLGDDSQISGITFPDGPTGKTIKIQFKANKPGFTQSGNGYFLETVAPYNYLKDLKPADVISSPKTTTKPLVWGPFMPSNVVTGESIKYVPNPYWYGPKPKLNSITYGIVGTAKTVAALKAKKYDFVTGTVNSQYAQIKNLSDYKVLGQQALAISLLYFNLGHYDAAKSINVQDRSTPLQDEKVRQAIGYARNVADVDKKFSNGLSTPANSVIPPIFSQFTDSSITGYEKQDIYKANKLLDEDGWKPNSKTGYREKDGKELDLVYAARVGDANSETIAQNYIQQWKKIGAKVTLYNDKLMEFNSWVDKMTTAPGDSKWDMTDGSWSLSSEPTQQDLFSAAAPYNFGHFVDSTITNDMNNIDSERSLDLTYRKQAFVKYQKDMNEKAYVIPTNFSMTYTPVNKRVVGFSLDNGDNTLWTDLGVSSNTLE